MRLLLVACPLLAGLPLLTACRLTATDVEPGLPAGRVEETATLAYYANGLPVLANNGGGLLGLLGTRPVTATLRRDSTLRIFATDINSPPSRTLVHNLVLVIGPFRGAGMCALAAGRSSGSEYYLTTFDAQGHPVEHAAQYPAAGAASQVVITGWNPATSVLQGTFALHVAGPNNPQTPTELRDGRFDLDVK